MSQVPGFELLALLNSVETANELAAYFNQSGHELIAKTVAKKILDQRNVLDGSFSKLVQLSGIADELTDDVVKAMQAGAHRLFAGGPQSHPVLLFPLRLETRFIAPTRHLPYQLWRLFVRIYPDQISVDAHEPRLTPTEYEAGKAYRAELADTAHSDPQSAWRRLAQLAGPERAAWIVKVLEEGGDINLRPDDSAWTVRPRLAAMPDRFVVYAYRADGTVLCRLGKSIQQGLTYTSDPTNEGLLDSDAAWVADFDAAVDAGMALRITLTEDRDHIEGFVRLVVVGVGNGDAIAGGQTLADLVDHHHYSTGLGFVQYGTPTNNTRATKSGHSDTKEDREASYEVEVIGTADAADPRANASQLAKALGFSPSRACSFDHVVNADDTSASYAEEVQTALWPATGDYMLRYLMRGVVPDEGLSRLSLHFTQHVRAAGPLPTIRIGKQPYGVLPVCAAQPKSDEKPFGWMASADDNDGDTRGRDFDAALHDTLVRLHTQWLTWAGNPARVPRVTAMSSQGAQSIADADAELLGILSMAPHSVDYRQRPFVAEGFVSWLLFALRKTALAPKPVPGGPDLAPLKKWFKEWDVIRVQSAGRLSALTGADSDKLRESLLLRMFGWWNDNKTELGITRHIGLGGDELPTDYLMSLAKGNDSGETRTLLRELLRRSLDLAPKSAINADTVREAIHRLSAPVSASDHDAAALLHFFNTATPEEMVRRIVDDPLFGKPSEEAYGIRHRTAERILQARNGRPDRKFRSVQEIDLVAGVGDDTLHDIKKAFPPKKVQADIDTLFRQTLDLCSHRLDAWITSLATKRLRAMRKASPTGIYLGAYGYVENLVPESSSRTSAGFIHTPSLAQAKAAAVMHSAYLTHNYYTGDPTNHPPNPARLNLTSARVRQALQIVEGVRSGQPLGALLGYQFEKRITEHGLAQYLDEFRAAFPIVANKQPAEDDAQAEPEKAVEAIAARNVVDGLALARWFEQRDRQDITPPSEEALAAVNEILATAFVDSGALRLEIQNLLDSLDGLSDLMLYEGVYHATQGNHERAAAALDVLSGGAFPSQIDSMSTPIAGNTLGHRVCLLFPQRDASEDDGPRARAEPSLAAWFAELVGSRDRIGASFEFQSKRLNLNETRSSESLLSELKRLPGMPETAAADIAGLITSRSPLKSLDDLHADLAGQPLAWLALSRWTWTGIDAELPFYERIDVNAAGAPDLQLLGLSASEADQIIDSRPFKRLSELRSPGKGGLSHDTLAKLQPWITTGKSTLSLADLIADGDHTELHLDPIDVLYLSATLPRAIDAFDDSSPLPPASQTEVEQRIAYWVRAEFGLRADERVEIGLGRPLDTSCAYGLGEALELGRQVLTMLGAGQTLRPEVLTAPSAAAPPVFSPSDVDAFAIRVNGIVADFERMVTKLQTLSIDDSADAQLKAELRTQLFLGSRYGVSGAIPFGPWASGSELEAQRKAVLAELLKRKAQFDSLVQAPAAPDSDANRRMDALVQAVKAVFGGGLTVIANCAVPKDLSDCFDSQPQQQALLAGLGEPRVRLWLQQAATVHPALLELEDTVITAELWQQGSSDPGRAVFHLRAAQLPLPAPEQTASPWLALSDAERGSRDEAGLSQDRANVSVVAAIANVGSGAATAPLVGLLLEQWEERIPSRQVTTGLSLHYDGPSTQAPQSLLLAVPSQMERTNWHLEELATTVCDTIDLAKVRLVDPDAMAYTPKDPGQLHGVGSLFPALLFPLAQDPTGSAPKTGAELARLLREET